ncbi:hypothetical protein FQA39_LY00746 [Lamprigera yunnana]|nr:hypothetical protein FQA39_LY00746 [Lamprigera yunnana]
MWMLYAQEHWTMALDLKSAVERLYEELGALKFDADHEAIYGMETYYTVQQFEELRDKYKIGKKDAFEKDNLVSKIWTGLITLKTQINRHRQEKTDTQGCIAAAVVASEKDKGAPTCYTAIFNSKRKKNVMKMNKKKETGENT